MCQQRVRICVFVLILVILLQIASIRCFECGVRKRFAINEMIVHGEPTSPGDWPWHAALYYRTTPDTWTYYCGGTLISELFVLTAAHCVKGKNGYQLASHRIDVHLGVYDRNHLNSKSFQHHTIHKIHNYKYTSKLRNDIALLELETEAEFTDFVQPACLNQVEDLSRQFGTAVGWGLDETDQLSSVLKSATMPVATTNECLESSDGWFRSILDSSMFCAGYGNGTTVCNGDSGGGLHFERNGVWYVGGVVSFSIQRNATNKCSLKSYGAFTNVYSFLPWIRDVARLVKPSKFNTRLQKANLDLLPTDCGHQLVNRIFAGSDAQRYEFPWIARFIVQDTMTGQLSLGCHGTLINNRYVLSSASCATLEPKPLRVTLGDYDTRHDPDCNCDCDCDCGCSPPVQEIGIESITGHPQFDHESFRHDIALLRLDQDVTFDDHIQPICLPVTQTLKQLRHYHYIVAGWGRFQAMGNYPVILQKATIQVMERSVCSAHFARSYPEFYVGQDVVCTGGRATANTCYLDKGAPLGHIAWFGNGVRFVQYGITSLQGCDEQPSTNTFVPNYMEWILANLRS